MRDILTQNEKFEAHDEGLRSSKYHEDFLRFKVLNKGPLLLLQQNKIEGDLGYAGGSLSKEP